MLNLIFVDCFDPYFLFSTSIIKSEHRCDYGLGKAVEARRAEVRVHSGNLGAGDDGRRTQSRPQDSREGARTGQVSRTTAVALSTGRNCSVSLTTDQRNPDNVGELLSRS